MDREVRGGPERSGRSERRASALPEGERARERRLRPTEQEAEDAGLR